VHGLAKPGPSVRKLTITGETDATAGSNLAPHIAYDDLREWFALAERLGEVKIVRGATWQEDIGLADGPVFENVMMGDDIDVTKFPSPVWHEKDGGRYIGTGTYSITIDP
jgi:3-polyprenyl-4-hydroxybenzoate decarboxylase